ncbi:MAG: TetR family transcriptional regulator [Pseudomonadota bacterium]|nr:TetR family transcriptional regulator [Pseudomonadota bacterium]
MARRTKDEAEQTRNALLDAAEEVFYEHGVARTSLAEIAKAAGVTRGAVYWHFRDKIELCEAMAQRVFLPQEEVIDRLASSHSLQPLEDLKTACCDVLKLIATDKRRYRVISILTHRCEYVEEMAAVMRRRHECKDHLLKRCQLLFERARKLGQLSPVWKPRLAAIGLQSLMSGLIVNSLEGRKQFDLGKTGPACIGAFFNSLIP